MDEHTPFTLPHWVFIVSFVSSVVSSLIILLSIALHLKNYRRPYQQRLMIRIQLIVPLFAVTCYSMLTNSKSPFNRFVLEPLREIYEAFVIYTFFSLLIDMLGGERNIIVTTSGRPPVSHPGILKHVFPAIDISDSSSFLMLKRGILQYVWIKPFICLGTILTEILGVYDVNNMSSRSFYLWLMVLYNMTVTISLYCLAMFWMILWNDLKPFDPVGKFLCVKLIIFASYWQGVILAVLNFLDVLPGSGSKTREETNIGLSIQNALLCVELIFFAIGHWLSFSYKPYTMAQMPYARLQFVYAVRDMFGINDLIHDFKLTFYGDYYKDYKTFDSVNASIAHPKSRSRMNKINQGLRYQFDGKHKHWLPINPDNKSIAENATIGGDSIYAPSIGASTKAIAPSSPKFNTAIDSSPSSPPLDLDPTVYSIAESLNSEDYDYDMEGLDEDEALYSLASGVINNYKLDQAEIKKLLNYPIVENTVDSHAYGYKVKKLRQNRLLLERGRTMDRAHDDNTTNYGSIV